MDGAVTAAVDVSPKQASASLRQNPGERERPEGASRQSSNRESSDGRVEESETSVNLRDELELDQNLAILSSQRMEASGLRISAWEREQHDADIRMFYIIVSAVIITAAIAAIVASIVKHTT